MSDESIDRDTHDHDMTYENEQSMVLEQKRLAAKAAREARGR